MITMELRQGPGTYGSKVGRPPKKKSKKSNKKKTGKKVSKSKSY